MNSRRITALVIAALVLGLVGGNVASGVAATADESTATTGTVAGLGLRLGGAMRDAGGRLADVVAKLTGLDAADVQEKRQAGTSFADIAAEKDVETSAIVDEALKVREQVLKDRVSDGSITQDQADAAIDRMRDRLNDRVTSTTQGCVGGGGGGMGGGMGRGARGAGGGGGACGAAVTQ